ncbi:MAG: fibrobacter succinogenes major paralogous domain-containing protein [Candidatus Cloacimonetes bacterium]|nr:fibrobacter succinogenes major paralogous domain-containing protein [Candidatus Cloacimonadota bacterium]
MNAGAKKLPAWCYYTSDTEYGKRYGKIYNWYAVIDPRGLSPEGWHVPSDIEWNELEKYLGANDIGTKIKSPNGWQNDGNGTNDSGFNGLPGGYRYSSDGSFNNCGDYGYWWSSTGNLSNDAWYRVLSCFDSKIGRYAGNKRTGFSVRCVRN